MKLKPIITGELSPVENPDGSITVTISTNAPILEGGPKRYVVWRHDGIDISNWGYGIGLYEEHNYDAGTLGVIDNIRTDDLKAKLLGDVKFRSDQRSQDFRRDVLNSTVRGISGGIDTSGATLKRIPGKDGNLDTFEVSGWRLNEASLTNMGADMRAGFGFKRTFIDLEEVDLDLVNEDDHMDEATTKDTDLKETEQPPEELALKELPQDSLESTEDPKEESTETKTQEAVEITIEEKIDSLQKQLDALKTTRTTDIDLFTEGSFPIGEQIKMLTKDAPLSQVVRTDSDTSYNFGSVLRSMAKRTSLTGAEAEYQAEAERMFGSTPTGGIYLNVPALSKRTMTTSTMAPGIFNNAGGNFGMLFPESIFGALGVTVKQASGPVQIAYQIGGPTVANRAENPGTGTTASDLTYNERIVKLVTATAKVIVSQDALSDTNIMNLEQDIQTSLKEQVRVSVERDAFGYASAPTAEKNQFGIYQCGTKIAWPATPSAGDLALTTAAGIAKLDSLTGVIEDANAGIGDVQYFVRPTDFNKLKYVPWQGSNGAKMLLQDGVLAENAPVIKASKDILGVGPTVAGDNDLTCTSTIVAVKKGAVTLYELAAPLIKVVEDENLVSKGLVCFHISYRYAVVLNRPEFATFLNVKL